MKTFFYITIVFLISFSTSCKTKKELISDTPPPKSSYETVSLPQIELREKGLSEEEMADITKFATVMANTYCEKIAVDKKLIGSPDREDIQNHKNELEQKLAKFEDKKDNFYYSTDLRKAEFDRVYNEKISNCN